jgi:endonuclease/exonuclease/phosphatase family metal-dependent hydrolase
MSPSSIWTTQLQASGQRPLARNQMLNLFIADMNRLADQNSRIPAHQPGDGKVRLMTYNVHEWADPNMRDKKAEILKVIATLQPDILVLQEIQVIRRGDKIKQTVQDLTALGYTTVIHVPLQISASYGSIGNLLATKLPVTQQDTKIYDIDNQGRLERRGYVHATMQLPNNQLLSVYGTHLDVSDTEHNRRAEVDELTQKANADSADNVVILGDFNAIRQRDYQYDINGQNIWQLLSKNEQARLRTAVPLQTLSNLENAGFQDSFSKANIVAPKFTTWTGTYIDFMYIRTRGWQLPIDGCYVQFNPYSDHTPVIMDLSVAAATTQPSIAQSTPPAAAPTSSPTESVVTITIPRNLVALADQIQLVDTDIEQSIRNLIEHGFENDQEKQATVRQWLNQHLRPSMDKAKIIATLHNIRGQDDELFNRIFASAGNLQDAIAAIIATPVRPALVVTRPIGQERPVSIPAPERQPVVAQIPGNLIANASDELGVTVDTYQQLLQSLPSSNAREWLIDLLGKSSFATFKSKIIATLTKIRNSNGPLFGRLFTSRNAVQQAVASIIATQPA